MLLGMIFMFCFGILRIFGVNRKKEENWKIWAKIGLQCHCVGNPRHCVGNQLHGIDPRQGVGHPRCGEAEVPKWHLSSTPRRSKAKPRRSPMPRSSAMPRRSYCSQKDSESLVLYTDSIGTLIND